MTSKANRSTKDEKAMGEMLSALAKKRSSELVHFPQFLAHCFCGYLVEGSAEIEKMTNLGKGYLMIFWMRPSEIHRRLLLNTRISRDSKRAESVPRQTLHHPPRPPPTRKGRPLPHLRWPAHHLLPVHFAPLVS